MTTETNTSEVSREQAELLACPLEHPAESGVSLTTSPEYNNPKYTLHTVRCLDCGLELTGSRTYEDVMPLINKWNTRISPTAERPQAREIVDKWREANEWPGLVWSAQNLSDEPRWLAAWVDLESRIASALTAERIKALEWQPIETAPKGVPILLVWANGSEGIQELSDKEAFWYEEAPTHWIPLPSPPVLIGTPVSAEPKHFPSSADGEEVEQVKCEVFDCNEPRTCFHYCGEHHRAICNPPEYSSTGER